MALQDWRKKISKQRSVQEYIDLEISKQIEKFCTKLAAWKMSKNMQSGFSHLLDLGNYSLPSCSAFKGIFPAIEGAAVWALDKAQS